MIEKVQINVDAQVFVHGFDLFVTVQLLVETPAVLLLDFLCSKHGCSFEWKTAKLHNWPNNGKLITCTKDNFVLLVVPGLSSYSSSSLSSTSRSIDQKNYYRKMGLLSGPVTTQHAKRACGKPMQTNPDVQASGSRGLAHAEDETDKEDPTQDIPDWLQPCTVNLEDSETHVLAHSSARENSDS